MPRKGSGTSLDTAGRVKRINRMSGTPDILPALEHTRFRYWKALLVGLAAFILYSGTIGYGLLWDDLKIYESLRNQGLSALLKSDFLRPGTGYYRPWVVFSLWLDMRAADFFPYSYHLTNVLLHAVNAALVCRLIGSLFPAGEAALWGGLLYAVHPVHTEAVSFVSARTDLWAAFFALSFALYWSRGRRAGGRLSWLSWPVFFALLAMAGLSKESAFMMPPVLVAWDAVLKWNEGDFLKGWLRRNGIWLSAATAALVFALALRWGVADVGFGHGIAQFGSGRQVAAVRDLSLIPSILATYLRLLVFPWPLTGYYTDAQLALGWMEMAAAALVAGACILTAGAPSKRAGVLGLLWIAGFLLPVSGLVKIVGSVVAERFLYLPAAGFAIVFGAAVSRLGLSPAGKRAAPAFALLLCSLAAAASAIQSRVWQNEISLFEHIVAVSDSDVGKISLANAYLKAGRDEEAHRLNGMVYMKLGQYKQAIASFQKMAISAGDSAEAMRLLGHAHLMAGRYAEAGSYIRRSLQDDPRSAQGHYLLGLLMFGTSDPEGAMRELEKALSIDPQHPDAKLYLGVSYSNAGRFREAVALLQDYLKSDPDSAEALYHLGLTNMRLGYREKAMEQCRVLEGIDPQWAERLCRQIQ